jgi:hypothetical protein
MLKIEKFFFKRSKQSFELKKSKNLKFEEITFFNY